MVHSQHRLNSYSPDICSGVSKAAKAKKGGEAWTLSQSSKDPAKVNAAKQALKGKLSGPLTKKASASKVMLAHNASNSL